MIFCMKVPYYKSKKRARRFFRKNSGSLTDPHLGHSQFRVLQLQRVNYEIVKNSTQIHFLRPKMAPHLETTII